MKGKKAHPSSSLITKAIVALMFMEDPWFIKSKKKAGRWLDRD